MVGTIRPVVHRPHSRLNWVFAMMLHFVGNMLGAIVMGSLFGIVGQLIVPGIGGPGLWISAAVAPIALMYSFAEADLIRLPHPQRDRQVPEIWRHKLHPQLTALLYGLALGMGLTTRIITRSLYIVVLGILACGNIVQAALTFSLFGLGRALPVAVIGWQIHSAVTGEQIHPILERIMGYRERVLFLNAFTLAIVGGYWLTGLVRFIY